MILTARDARNAGMCISGQKMFCEAHGIDFKEFLRSGIDTEELQHIDDANLAKAIALVEQRSAEYGRR